ncbi:MAG: sulfite exporter TauE/SafE family protein [Methylococcaceae bacterium]|nr:sulfite exporter TauE/SafE family protein [Methylococcaceae bacterium]
MTNRKRNPFIPLALRTQAFVIHGMHCAGCEAVIENAIRQLPGILAVRADYTCDTLNIHFDETLITVALIHACIETQGYQLGPERFSETFNGVPSTTHDISRQFSLLGVLKKSAITSLAVVGIVLILCLDRWFTVHADRLQLGQEVSYSLLLLIGFLTSFHCAGMCGSLMLGYVAKNAASASHPFGSHLLYGFGKTLSYTLIGALFGALGSVIAFTPVLQGAVGVAAGIFLLLFGLHMLEVFSTLRHFQMITPPLIRNFVGNAYRRHSNPFIIGLLNGLMIICGPLQAMYVMAAGTGHWIEGAAMLFFFGLGTLPLLLGFGFLTSLLSASLTPRLLKASGFLVIALGVIMLNRGLVKTGTGIDFNTTVARLSQELSPALWVDSPSADQLQIITMEVLSSGYSPNQFTLRKGVPVKWLINAKALTQCNRVILVPQYHLRIELKEGLQTIEFMPPENGIIPWSCWMGMNPGIFIVVEDGPPLKQQGTEAMAKAWTTYWDKLAKFYHQCIQRLRQTGLQ